MWGKRQHFQKIRDSKVPVCHCLSLPVAGLSIGSCVCRSIFSLVLASLTHTLCSTTLDRLPFSQGALVKQSQRISDPTGLCMENLLQPRGAQLHILSLNLISCTLPAKEACDREL